MRVLVGSSKRQLSIITGRSKFDDNLGDVINQFMVDGIIPPFRTKKFDKDNLPKYNIFYINKYKDMVNYESERLKKASNDLVKRGREPPEASYCGSD